MTNPTTKPAPPTEPSTRDEQRVDSALVSDLRDVMHRRLGHALALACAAGCVWFFAVRPVERAYAARVTERETLEAKVARSSEVVPASHSAQAYAAELNGLLTDIRSWSEPSHDQRGLYDALTRLAAATHVRLERIDPTSGQSIAPNVANTSASSQPRSRRNRSQQATSQAAWTGRTVGHRLLITGTYEHISEFIAACETDLGATKVLTFRIGSEPVREDQPGIVEATLETVHLALIPPAPAARSQDGPASATEGGTP